MTSITWSGLTWDIRNDQGGPYGPGPNYFDGQGVSVDTNGALHLKIQKDANGHWQCPEIITEQKFCFGEYKFVDITTIQNGKTLGIQNLDNNAVLGLFPYPTPDLGPDGTHEMDIELSRWGNTPDAYPYFMNWSTYLTYLKSNPMNIKEQQNWQGGCYPVGYNSNAPQTHVFYRTANDITFKAVNSWTGDVLASLHETGFTPQTISQAAMPLHINLWLTYGNPPAGNAPVEVVINKFIFTPQQ